MSSVHTVSRRCWLFASSLPLTVQITGHRKINGTLISRQPLVGVHTHIVPWLVTSDQSACSIGGVYI